MTGLLVAAGCGDDATEKETARDAGVTQKQVVRPLEERAELTPDTGRFAAGGTGSRMDTLIFADFSLVSPTFPAAPEPIFLYLHQNNCSFCEEMETNVLSRPEIARHINERYIPVDINIDEDMPVTIMGRKYDLIHLRQLLKPHGFPAYYFFDRDGKLIGMLDSAMPVKTFKQLLIYVDKRHFMKTPWQEFLKLPEADVDTVWGEF
jgi:thioredoxin-related protein